MLLIIFVPGVGHTSESPMVVVVHVNNPTQQMSKSQVIDLYMGKYVAFPNGDKAEPIDISDSDTLKKNFYRLLVGMPLARVNAYWSRIKFSGRARPPLEKKTSGEALEYLSDSPNAIAYIRLDELTNDVKVVYSFDE